MKKRIFNFGIIGGSGYALVLLDCLEAFIERGECRLAAAAVLPSEQGSDIMQRAKIRGTRIFDNWQEMLKAMRGKLDICIIPTGIAHHRPMATLALEMGHKVLLEKPLAGSFEDALAIARMAQTHSDNLSVGYHDIYQPSTYHIRELVWSGKIGRINSIRGYGLWPRNNEYYQRNSWVGRNRVAEGWVRDSPLNNALAHYLNLMLFFASLRSNESARFDRIDIEMYRARPIESFDTGSIRIHTEAGFPIELHVTHSCRTHKDPHLRIEGERGRVDWYAFSHYEVHADGATERFPLDDSPALRNTMFKELMQWLDGKPALRCTAAQALGQSLCIETLHSLPPAPLIEPQFITPDVDTEVPIIRDIDALFELCFEQGGLPAEHHAPWSAGVRTVDPSIPGSVR